MVILIENLDRDLIVKPEACLIHFIPSVMSEGSFVNKKKLWSISPLVVTYFLRYFASY